MRASTSLLLFFLIMIASCSGSVIPNNIVQNHIKNIADFSVDPCDDFYAHVCPMGISKQDFLKSIFETKLQIVRDYKLEHPENLFVNAFSVDKTKNLSNIVTQFLHSNESSTLCNIAKKIVSDFTRHLLSFDIEETALLQDWEKSSCEQKMEMVRNLSNPTQKFINSRMVISQAIDGSIASSLMEKLDKKLRQLFQKLKMAVLKELRKTPWAVYNGSLDMYEDALQKINFTTFSDIRKPLKYAQSVFIQAKSKCIDVIRGKYSVEIEDGLCEVIAVGEAVLYINKPMNSIYETDLRDILTDQTAALNSKDTCDTRETFEEDAADLAAYRIVWNLYKKAYTRKTVVKNYESLNKKQLFFYGAAVVLCSPYGMEENPSHDTLHSNSYQRVNSLMSQMDGFSEAFKCKPTDRMVRNRARTCELYGAKADGKEKI
ncbi:Protein CBG15395 [Caenorhabditis briggsae]|uniref:Protein CBG15395 n=1 Tax=Caenorhabditis briggsae TaxID=6238 RepID=A8XMD2_CAEBR|nr:Protein CBG15395 [Caenorhabditis briggsae]CAP33807.2 Protein CBG15395 [Caenorhabditis briggsae]